MLTQRTIKKDFSVTGIGLHTGKLINITFHPAPVNHGIVFKRTDIPNSTPIKATFENVSATENATTIGSGINIVHTIEHLFSVLYGLGIDNVYCEINGPEVPIMDGSGASFAFLLKENGIEGLNRPKNFIIITEPIRVELGEKWAMFTPSSTLEIDSTIVFAHPVIKTQKMNFQFSCETFFEQIARARTFGFLRDVDMLKRKGLIKGGSLNNAIILDDFNVVNPEGLRFKDEFVRHKILDTIGDVALLGHEIAGKITAYKSGHHLHNLLCRKLFSTPTAYKIIPSDELNTDAVKAFDLPGTLSAPLFY